MPLGDQAGDIAVISALTSKRRYRQINASDAFLAMIVTVVRSNDSNSLNCDLLSRQNSHIRRPWADQVAFLILLKRLGQPPA